MLKEAADRLDIYEEYLSWEKNPKEGGNKPNRIICLYERAVADIPLTRSLWENYSYYVADTIKDADTVLNICKRSVANCTWASELWNNYLIHAEANNKTSEEMTGLLPIF